MTIKVTLYELIEKSANAALPMQNENGTMPPGHNGPWNDTVTPLRNTGHWLVTFAKAYKITGKQKYLRAMQRAVDYLLSEDSRPGGAAFWHRDEPHKDASNGLIGQAWTIESLAVASDLLDRPNLGKLAEEVFLLHPFDESLSLWSTINLDGSPRQLMPVLNQQIWFAAAGSMIASLSHTSEEVNIRVNGFIRRFLEYLTYNRHGIIRHVFYPFPLRGRVKDYLHYLRKSGVQLKRARELAIGYQTFNLYGLALLKQAYPNAPLLNDKKLDPVWKLIISKKFNELARNNPYAYFYNPSGIEIGFALSVFHPNSDDLKDDYLAEQFSLSFNFDTNFMERGATGDPLTLAARLYEATRLPDCPLYL